MSAPWAFIIGKALEGVGAGVQLGQSLSASKAMQKELSKQLKEQSGYRERATYGTQFPALEGWSAENAVNTMATNRAASMQGYEPLSTLPAGTGGMSDLDLGFLRNMGQRRATLGSYGKWLGQKEIDQIRLAEAIQRIVSRAGGSVQVLPYLLQAASGKNAWMQALGALIRQGGGVLEQVGSFKGGGGGGKTLGMFGGG